MKLAAITVSCCLLAASLNAPAGQVYKWVDETGRAHFTDRKPEDQDAEKFELKNIQTIKSVSYERSPIDTGKKVVIYTTSTCGYCKKAKAYFEEKGIQYKEMNIEEDGIAQRQYKKLGGKGVPVILVGDKRMNGFSEEGFEKIYR